MRNISAKFETMRVARAEAIVTMSASTMQLLQEGNAPKGDPIPMARTAAIMAAKKTSDLIPYCHPLLIDCVTVEFEYHAKSVAVIVEVTAVAKTGVEMEAMTAATVAALTLYDMLKPVDKEMEIVGCRLLEKRGGKSSFPAAAPLGLAAAILVVSDSSANGTRVDRSGAIIRQRLEGFGIDEIELAIVPDEKEQIAAALVDFSDAGCHLVLTTGGTGASPRDVTVEATETVIERELPGIAEAMRAYGQRRTPFAMLSRGVAGLRDDTVIINLPGSPTGADECLAAILPALFHLFPMLEGKGH